MRLFMQFRVPNDHNPRLLDQIRSLPRFIRRERRPSAAASQPMLKIGNTSLRRLAEWMRVGDIYLEHDLIEASHCQLGDMTLVRFRIVTPPESGRSALEDSKRDLALQIFADLTAEDIAWSAASYNLSDLNLRHPKPRTSESVTLIFRNQEFSVAKKNVETTRPAYRQLAKAS